MFKHALCLHPYYRDSHSGSLGLAVFPPTGLEYIAAALEPHVDRVTVLDLRIPGPMRNLATLKKFVADEIDLLCISVNWEYQFSEVCELVNSLPGSVFTVIGGKQATDYVEEVFDLCPGVDIIVRGEGEEAIAEIAKGFRSEDVDGISYRNGSEVTHNPKRTLQKVDSYRFPNRELRQQKYHFNIGGFALRGEEFDIIVTARGCPYQCKFCTFTLNPWGQKRVYSARSIESVMDEIRGISAGIILIADEDFFVNPARAKAICERIVAEGIEKRFLVQARIEIFKHPEVLEAAEKAGIKMFLLGIESPTDRILEQLNKGFDTAVVRNAFETFRKYPFYYHGYFIYGNVTETDEEMMQIPVFAKELGLDSITYQKLRIEKYSPLKELVEATPGYYIGDDRILYREGAGRPGLKRISSRITRKFYTPAQVLGIAWKVFRIRLFTTRNIAPLLLALPIVLGHTIGRKVDKKLRRFQFWRLLLARTRMAQGPT
ncbi:MAG: B12-binding domain-containing radical SAM protein [Desulfomonile tiedjei]|uniref:B12-binding domain-containing radical SAM protein n=1 Tax=Desulfomonile tiedjei TaxID=2358 RepID=A0A9D6Z2G3_9BACT|nr:B12-binding domain-containing radical SAM protein [Desulfomonile tiedjei]